MKKNDMKKNNIPAMTTAALQIIRDFSEENRRNIRESENGGFETLEQRKRKALDKIFSIFANAPKGLTTEEVHLCAILTLWNELLHCAQVIKETNTPEYIKSVDEKYNGKINLLIRLLFTILLEKQERDDEIDFQNEFERDEEANNPDFWYIAEARRYGIRVDGLWGESFENALEFCNHSNKQEVAPEYIEKANEIHKRLVGKLDKAAVCKMQLAYAARLVQAEQEKFRNKQIKILNSREEPPAIHKIVTDNFDNKIDDYDEIKGDDGKTKKVRHGYSSIDSLCDALSRHFKKYGIYKHKDKRGRKRKANRQNEP